MRLGIIEADLLFERKVRQEVKAMAKRKKTKALKTLDLSGIRCHIIHEDSNETMFKFRLYHGKDKELIETTVKLSIKCLGK